MAGAYLAEIHRIGAGGELDIIPYTKMEYPSDSGKFLPVGVPASVTGQFVAGLLIAQSGGYDLADEALAARLLALRELG